MVAGHIEFPLNPELEIFIRIFSKKFLVHMFPLANTPCKLFLSKIEISVKNQYFGQKSIFWSKIQILANNTNVR